MFANDKSIDNLEALFKEIKKHIELQGQYIKLDLVEKLTIMLVYALVPVVGSIIASYAVIGAVILIAAIGIYLMRRKLIFQPMVNFLARLFLEDSHK